MEYREKYKEELQTAYDKPLDAAEFESVAAWIDRVAAGEYADADVMSLVAVRESLRAEVARLTEERERTREEIEIAIRTLDGFEHKSEGQRINNIISATKRHLQASLESEAPNDSTKPKKTMTQREWDLRHANPYDLSGPHQPQMKRGLNG